MPKERNRGFKDVTNEAFEHNSLRFRNALVRASFSNDALGVAANMGEPAGAPNPELCAP